jgi:hypothetical protein
MPAYWLRSALTDKHKQLVDGKKRASGATKRTRSRDNKRQKGSGRNTAKTTTAQNNTCDYYCYLHGKQNSHTSAQCKVMTNDNREHFTAAMRNAKTSSTVEGGSTAVKGKPGTQVAARGYMMTDETDSTSENATEPPVTI